MIYDLAFLRNNDVGVERTLVFGALGRGGDAVAIPGQITALHPGPDVDILHFVAMFADEGDFLGFVLDFGLVDDHA